MTDAGADRRPYAVVDASVCLKWALDDEDMVEQALAIRDAGIDGTVQLAAPSVWVYEITNALASAVRRKRITADAGREAAGAFFSIGVRIADPEPLHVFDTAVASGLTAYDAAYVALAEVLGCPCWTADRQLAAACAVHDLVSFLADFPMS